MKNIKINNLSAFAKKHKDITYIIYRECDGECWYYGCSRDKSKAFDVANEINGCMVERDYVIGLD